MPFVNGRATEGDVKLPLYYYQREQTDDLVSYNFPANVQAFHSLLFLNSSQRISPSFRPNLYPEDRRWINVPFSYHYFDTQNFSDGVNFSDVSRYGSNLRFDTVATLAGINARSTNVAFLFQRYSDDNFPFAERYSTKLYEYFDYWNQFSIPDLENPDDYYGLALSSWVFDEREIVLPDNNLEVVFKYYIPEYLWDLPVNANVRTASLLENNTREQLLAASPANFPNHQQDVCILSRIYNECIELPACRRFKLHTQTKLNNQLEITLRQDILIGSLVVTFLDDEASGNTWSSAAKEFVLGQIPNHYKYENLDSFFSHLRTSITGFSSLETPSIVLEEPKRRRTTFRSDFTIDIDESITIDESDRDTYNQKYTPRLRLGTQTRVVDESVERRQDYFRGNLIYANHNLNNLNYNFFGNTEDKRDESVFYVQWFTSTGEVANFGVSSTAFRFTFIDKHYFFNGHIRRYPQSFQQKAVAIEDYVRVGNFPNGAPIFGFGQAFHIAGYDADTGRNVAQRIGDNFISLDTRTAINLYPTAYIYDANLDAEVSPIEISSHFDINFAEFTGEFSSSDILYRTGLYFAADENSDSPLEVPHVFLRLYRINYAGNSFFSQLHTLEAELIDSINLTLESALQTQDSNGLLGQNGFISSYNSFREFDREVDSTEIDNFDFTEYERIALVIFDQQIQPCEGFMCDCDELNRKLDTLIAALNADNFVIREGNLITKIKMNLGELLVKTARVLGLNFEQDGRLKPILPAQFIRTSGELPPGHELGQWGTFQVSVDVDGQPRTEDREGIAYPIKSNTFGVNPQTGEPNQIEQGGFALVENIPQYLAMLENDLDRALSWGDLGAVAIPNSDGSGIAFYEGLGRMMMDSLFNQSHLSRAATGAHIMGLKNQAQLQELLAGIGLPGQIKEIQITLADGQQIPLPVTGVEEGSPTLIDIMLLGLINTGYLVGNQYQRKATEEETGQS